MATSPRPWASAAAATSGIGTEAVRAVGHPGRGIDRTTRLLSGPDPGHHEWHEEDPFVDGGRAGERLAT